MHENGVVLPFLDVDLEKVLALLALEMRQHDILDVFGKSVFEVIVEILGLIELVAHLQDDSIFR